jgi:hypothetical protein
MFACFANLPAFSDIQYICINENWQQVKKGLWENQQTPDLNAA